MAEKRLTRSSSDKVIAGVCGGLGAYFGLDPMLVRVLFIVAAFFMGATFWIYLILWLILPLDTAKSGSDTVSTGANEMAEKANEVMKGVEKGLKGDNGKK
ncbi:MAG: PspC domain-containing protein [Candidatus Dojkabacteria bacterium]|nr:MAG: PspC domain-containing protein [Candidatus Dojkabacteria bacterium]